MGSFSTAINCMDGRAQMPVFKYMQDKFSVDFVDTITEAGAVKFLANDMDQPVAKSIFERVDISVNKHNSKGIAIIGHWGCAGNPIEDEPHIEQVKSATKNLKEKYPDVPIIGLWLDETFTVKEIVSL